MEYKALIPFLVFLYIFNLAYRRNNKISMTIVGLYLTSAFCSFFMDVEVMPSHDFEQDSVLYFILYTLLLVPFLLLTLHIKPFVSVQQLPKGKLFNAIIVILSFGAIFSIIYLTPYAIQSLSVPAYEVRQSITESSVLPPNLLTTIAVGFPTFYFVYAFIFYVSLIQKKSLIIQSSMLIGVLSFIVNVFTVAGRDGVLFCGLALIIGYFLFEPLIHQKTQKMMKRLFILGSVLCLLIIVSITGERFSDSNAAGFNLRAFKVGIVSYLGMQPYIFSDWLQYNDFFNSGYSHFRLIVENFGVVEPVNPRAFREPYTWMFGTFLTAFYAISGFTSLFIVSFIFWAYFKVNLKLIIRKKMQPLGIYFFLSLFFHFIISGLFYFRLGNSGGNLFILMSIFAAFYFKKSIKL
ncbi:hypothetical protein [Chryseobacterium sp. A321]